MGADLNKEMDEFYRYRHRICWHMQLVQEYMEVGQPNRVLL